MFFARLAIAALSLGSAATVFAAQLRIPSDLASGISFKLPAQRDVLAFHEAVTYATTTLEELERQIFTLAANPGSIVTSQLVAMNQVASAMSIVTERLSAAGTNRDSILATAEGGMLAPDALAAEMNSMLIAVGGILTCVQGLKSTASIQPSAAHLKDQVTALQAAVNEVVPEISGSLDGVIINILHLITISIEL